MHKIGTQNCHFLSPHPTISPTTSDYVSHHNQHFFLLFYTAHCRKEQQHCIIYWSMHSFYSIHHHPKTRSNLCSSLLSRPTMNDENFIKRCVCTRCRFVPENQNLSFSLSWFYYRFFRSCVKMGKLWRNCRKREKGEFFLNQKKIFFYQI